MPPPVVPQCDGSLGLGSFHTYSWKLDPATLPTVVPPTASTHGSLPGYCTCALPLLSFELEPVSPLAMHTVMPWIAASWNAAETALMKAVVMPSAASVAASSPFDRYQLLESTEHDGSPAPGCATRWIMSTQPACDPVVM